MTSIKYIPSMHRRGIGKGKVKKLTIIINLSIISSIQYVAA